MTEISQTSIAPSRTRSFVDRHLALVLGLALVAFAVLRVYFVAGFDLATALAILAVVDRPQLLAATLLSAIALLLPLMIVNPSIRKWILAGNRDGATFGAQLRSAVVGLPLFGVSALVLSVPLVAGWVIAAGGVLLVRRRVRKRAAVLGPLSRRDSAVRAGAEGWKGWVAAMGIGLLTISSLNSPWLSQEALELKSSEIVAGRIVGEQAGMMLVLQRRGGSAVWVRSDEVESRRLCGPRVEWWSHSVAELLRAPSRPVCADLEGAAQDSA
jgi:hypothetical protein